MTEIHSQHTAVLPRTNRKDVEHCKRAYLWCMDQFGMEHPDTWLWESKLDNTEVFSFKKDEDRFLFHIIWC